MQCVCILLLFVPFCVQDMQRCPPQGMLMGWLVKKGKRNVLTLFVSFVCFFLCFFWGGGLYLLKCAF